MLPGIIFMIVGLLVSVALHELGHFIPAKKFGARVSQYFIGFGPTLWSIHRGGTEYGIKAIPLGGFVSIGGMLPPAPEGTVTTRADGSLTLAEEARQQAAEEFDNPAQPGAFWRLPARLKMIVMFAGPVMNLIISVVVIAGVTLGLGVIHPTTTVANVAKCLDPSAATCVNAPANGVLHEQDRIVSWAGTPVTSWEDITSAIAKTGTQPADVVVERDGKKETLTITPVQREFVDNTGQKIARPYVGIGPAFERRAGTLADVGAQSAAMATGTVQILAQLPVKLWEAGTTLFTGEKRSPDSLVGVVGIADVAGSITAVPNAQYGWWDRVADLFMLLAGLNMTLFIFNIIPLLPLDGGHILGAVIEGVRRHVAFARGKADPGPFDTARLLPLSYAVIMFFVFMTVLLTIVDIVNPIV